MAVATAVVETNNGGTNNVVDFTYNEEGAEGNYTGVTILAPTVAGQTLAIDYGVTTPNVITVRPASTDGSTITTTGTLLISNFNGTKASATITGDSGGTVSDGDTITIGGTTYTFKTALGSSGTIPYQVLIGSTGSSDAALNNLAKAMLNAGTAGTNYGTGTLPHATVVSASSVSSHNLVLTAAWPGTSYNLIPIALSSSDASVTIAGSTLGGSGNTAGVEPLNWPARALFTAAPNGTVTGILAAGAFTTASTGSTVGVDDTNGYTSLTTAATLGGWVFPGSGAATVIENDSSASFRINGANGDNTITNYTASIQHKDGSRSVQQALTLNELLLACKTHVRQRAARNNARDWTTARGGYYSPLLYTA